MKKKLQTFANIWLSFLIGKSYFSIEGSQNFLIFQPILNTFTMPIGLTETIVTWESKGLPNEKIKTPATTNTSLAPRMKWIIEK